MKLRQKAPEAIRRDALQMAARKFSEGCDECGMGYLELAKEHGATTEELAGGAEWKNKQLSRREVFRFGAASAALALGWRFLEPMNAFASTTYHWGTDTNTKSCSAIPQNFYVGRAGGGTTQNWNYFNVSAARAAGIYSTYMYWDLVGPGLTPSGKTDYQWGQMQADAAATAFGTGTDAAYVQGATIFADIEGGNSGNWGSYTGSRDQNIVKGWNDEILRKGFWPGIYISLANWGSYFGTGFRPSTAFVLWLTGCHTDVTCNPGSGSTCACDPRAKAQSLWSYPSGTILGGCRTVLWQFYTGPDYDLSTQDPLHGFAPITSSTTYHNGC